ncbi:MAG: ABC transporter ATP-binding protein [Proteobacteria bacterium]|nr:ABC transporter ATP-binding protein [Pseudomonadota bacterium]
MLEIKDNQLLNIENLKVGFETSKGFSFAVNGVNVSINPGETFALVGESGCGKSMTALSILQLLPGSALTLPGSHIFLKEKDLAHFSEVELRHIRGKRVGIIFQEPMTSLNPIMTIGDQIAEVLKCHLSLSHSEQQNRILELLKSVGMPEPKRRLHEYPHQLSGGLKQRAMIAIALAADPELLIADEPTTALDVTIQAQVLSLLKEIQANTGMAILLITHDLGVVRQMADTVGVMYAGHIVEQAPVELFFENPLHPYSRQLFQSIPTEAKRGEWLTVIKGSVPPLTVNLPPCRFADRCPLAFETCYQKTPKWLLPDPKHHVRCHLYDPAIVSEPDFTALNASAVVEFQENIQSDTESLLTVNDLKIYFPIRKGLFKRKIGDVKAVDGVNLKLKKGKTVALVGESGCGKTTVARGILRLLEPTSGEILYQEKNLASISDKELRSLRRELQIIFQDPFSSMNPRMMVGEIITEGLVAQHLIKDTHHREIIVEELLEQVGLPKDSQYRYPHEFSGGQRQRICIARALALKPKIIICDEPTSALDVSIQAQILNLLKQLQAQHQLSYLFITHNISVVSYIADEVAVMYLGRIVEQGPVDEVLNHPKHPYTQALLASVPTIDKASKLFPLSGELPSAAEPPSGCHFHPRCRRAMAICHEKYPEISSVGEAHEVKCFLYGKEER